jgi:protein-disulfide isomerase
MRTWGLPFAVAASLSLAFGLFVSGAHGDTQAPPAKGSASAAAAPASWSDADAFPPVTSNDPMWGDRTAPVTLVVFTDLQCRFCAKLNETFAELKKKYGPTTLRVITKHHPLTMHQDARAASIAAETVFRIGGSAAFYTFTDLAFANQQALTDANFGIWSKAAGVDRKQVTSDVLKAAAKKVDADLAEGGAMSVTGTPASFVNGVLVSGSQGVEKFVEVIEAELVRAQALRKKVPAEKLYVRLTQEAKARAAAESAKKKPAKP